MPLKTRYSLLASQLTTHWSVAEKLLSLNQRLWNQPTQMRGSETIRRMKVGALLRLRIHRGS